MPPVTPAAAPPTFQLPSRVEVEDAVRRGEELLRETPAWQLPQPGAALDVLQRRQRTAAALAAHGDAAGAHAVLVGCGQYQIRCRRPMRLHDGDAQPGDLVCVTIDKAQHELESGAAESADPLLDREMTRRGFASIELTADAHLGGPMAAGERRWIDRGAAQLLVLQNRARYL